MTQIEPVYDEDAFCIGAWVPGHGHDPASLAVQLLEEYDYKVLDTSKFLEGYWRNVPSREGMRTIASAPGRGAFPYTWIDNDYLQHIDEIDD